MALWQSGKISPVTGIRDRGKRYAHPTPGKEIFSLPGSARPVENPVPLIPGYRDDTAVSAMGFVSPDLRRLKQCRKIFRVVDVHRTVGQAHAGPGRQPH
jgi:hypothetical protein